MWTGLKGVFSVAILATPLAGCAVPSFDLPRSEEQKGPSIDLVYDRIVCELVDLFNNKEYKDKLIDNKFSVAISLSLEISDKGEIKPSFSFPSVGTNLSIGVNFLSRNTRKHTFTTKRTFEMIDIHNKWKSSSDSNFGICPENSNHYLTGRLGIDNIVRLGFTGPNPNFEENIDKGGAFGGVIKFIVTKNVNSAGPTWNLTSFVGPGGFGSLERTSTNMLTITFAGGKTTADQKGQDTGAPFFGRRAPRSNREAAESFLNELLLRDDN